MERKEVEPMSIFHLKCIALVCMVLDHIGFYFEAAPPWLGCIGRISYPLFLFCMVWAIITPGIGSSTFCACIFSASA